MRKERLITVAGFAAVAVFRVGFACYALAAEPSARQPDVSRGAMIAAQGTPGGAPPCAQCHAFNGASDGSGAFPRIAGQSSYYLEKQMHDFASPVRTNAIMSPVAKAMSSDEITDVAAYYANANAEYLPMASGDAAIIEKGRQLARVGDATRDLQSCNNCHGPDGAGIPPAIPYLAGQYAHYIVFELQMWQRGFRNSSPESMALIAKQLDEQQIAAVAAYYQQVRSSTGVATTK